MTKLNVNGNAVEVDVDPETPLLWVLRDTLGLTGTKFGCGMALCGACTVHLAGEPVRSCQVPVSAVGEKPVTTIEGCRKTSPVQRRGVTLHRNAATQSADHVRFSALIASNPRPTIRYRRRMAGNICVAAQ